MGLLLKPTLFAALAVVLSAGPLQAQNTKSFVSTAGNDGNTCATEALACRTLSGAIGKTNANGIIYCLDNGEFSSGTLTITKAITIDCAGTGGSLKVGGIVMSITAAAADVIHIRGLKIHSFDKLITIPSTGGAASVRIEDCNLVGTGVQPAVSVGGTSSSGIIEVLLARTTISGGSTGVLVQPNGGGAKLALDNVRIFNSGIGLDLQGTNATAGPTNLRVAVKNSTIMGNTNQGVLAQSTNGLTRVFLKDTQVVQNGTGLQATGSGAGIHASHSTITQNGTNLSAVSGGVLISFGNNEVFAPLTTNGAFTTTHDPAVTGRTLTEAGWT